jgi:hypothetical protein
MVFASKVHLNVRTNHVHLQWINACRTHIMKPVSWVRQWDGVQCEGFRVCWIGRNCPWCFEHYCCWLWWWGAECRSLVAQDDGNWWWALENHHHKSLLWQARLQGHYTHSNGTRYSPEGGTILEIGCVFDLELRFYTKFHLAKSGNCLAGMFGNIVADDTSPTSLTTKRQEVASSVCDTEWDAWWEHAFPSDQQILGGLC